MDALCNIGGPKRFTGRVDSVSRRRGRDLFSCRGHLGGPRTAQDSLRRCSLVVLAVKANAPEFLDLWESSYSLWLLMQNGQIQRESGGQEHPSIQHVKQLTNLLRRWHLSPRGQTSLQHLVGLLDADFRHPVLDHKWAVSTQPSRHLRLDLIHEDTIPKMLPGFVRNDADVDAVEQGIDTLTLPLMNFLHLLHCPDGQTQQRQ